MSSRKTQSLTHLVAGLLAITLSTSATHAQCQLAKITAPDGRDGDRFGHDVAIDGDRLLIGTPAAVPQTGFHSRQTGAAYALRRSGTYWSQEASLVARDLEGSASLGSGVALDGDFALVADGSGDAAFMFRRFAGSWQEESGLTPSFGSVALSGEYALLVGSSANAFLFYRAGVEWPVQSVLTIDAPPPTTGLGRSVAIDGDVAIMGAPVDDTLAEDAGAAYMFRRAGNTLRLLLHFIASGCTRLHFSQR